MTTDALLTVTDVATHLNVTTETVREWLRRGELNGFNFGGRAGWRVSQTEVERLLASKTVKRTRTNPRPPGTAS